MPSQPATSSSHCETKANVDTLSIEELRIENQLLEQHLKEKNVDVDLSTLDNDNADFSADTPIEVKLQLAIECLSKTNNVLETRREASIKLLSTIKVMLSEVDMRIGDIQRDAHTFKRDVVDGGRCVDNPDRYQAERLVRYFDGKIYDQESSLDKLSEFGWCEVAMVLYSS